MLYLLKAKKLCSGDKLEELLIADQRSLMVDDVSRSMFPISHLILKKIKWKCSRNLKNSLI